MCACTISHTLENIKNICLILIWFEGVSPNTWESQAFSLSYSALTKGLQKHFKRKACVGSHLQTQRLEQDLLRSRGWCVSTLCKELDALPTVGGAISHKRGPVTQAPLRLPVIPTLPPCSPPSSLRAAGESYATVNWEAHLVPLTALLRVAKPVPSTLGTPDNVREVHSPLLLSLC